MRPILAALFVLAAAPVAAEPFRATYGVMAGGMTVMELEAVFDLDRPGTYRIETSMRLRGMAAAMISGQQVTRVEGAWEGAAARPTRYSTEGVWRGNPRRILLDYENGQPVVRALEPPNEGEREPVPPELARGTMDSLSALAQLTRSLAATERCDATAAVYDGRRRTDFAATTGGWEFLPPWRQVWSGNAIRCGFEGRMVAGFMLDQDRAEEARRPQQGTAWMASVLPGTRPIPVRVEVQTRWFGKMTAYLLSAAPVSNRASTGTNSPGVVAMAASPSITP